MAVTSGGGGLDPDFLANFNPANYRAMPIPSPDGAAPIGPAPAGPGPAMPLNFGGFGGGGGVIPGPGSGNFRGFGGFGGVTPGPGGGPGVIGGPPIGMGPIEVPGGAAPVGPGRMTPGMPAAPFASLVGQKVLERLMGIQGAFPGVTGSAPGVTGNFVTGSPGVSGSGGYGDAIGLSQAIARLLAMLNR